MKNFKTKFIGAFLFFISLSFIALITEVWQISLLAGILSIIFLIPTGGK